MTKVRRDLIAITFAISCLACVLCAISLSTNNWLNSQVVLTSRLSSEVNYGLFCGALQRRQLAATLPFELNVVCDFSKGVCMYSCHKSGNQRQDELKRILSGLQPIPCEQNSYFAVESNSTIKGAQEIDFTSMRNVDHSVDFIPADMWLTTAFFLSFAIIFKTIAVALTLLNLKYNPVESIFNIFGLFIWNGLAASSALIALTTWTVIFKANLRNNIAITDTLRHEFRFSSQDSASLGFSYYTLAASLLLSVANLVVLFWRRHVMLRIDVPPTISLELKDVPLQFY